MIKQNKLHNTTRYDSPHYVHPLAQEFKTRIEVIFAHQIDPCIKIYNSNNSAQKSPGPLDWACFTIGKWASKGSP